MKQQYPTNKAPQLIIENCAGPLVVKAHDQAVMTVSGPQATVTQDEAGEVFQVTSQGPLTIIAPVQTELLVRNVAGTAVFKGLHNQTTIENAKGNVNGRGLGTLIVKSLHGSLAAKDIDHSVYLGEVHGDVSLRNTQDITLQNIRGDFMARNVTGTVQVTHSDGDVVLRNVSGDVTVAYCDRDVSLRNIAGLVQISDVKGDIRLREALPPGEHRLQAQGDIVVRWPEASPVNLQASARAIHNHLPLVAWPTAKQAKADQNVDVDVDIEIKLGFDEAEVEELKQETQAEAGEPTLQEEHGRVYLRGRLGDGDCNLTLESQADIILRAMSVQDPYEHGSPNFEFEMDFGFVHALEKFGEKMAGLGESIAHEVSAHMANMSSELENELGSKYADQMATKAERAVERAMRKTEEALKRMQRQSAYASPPPPPRAPHPPQKPQAPSSPTAQKTEDTTVAQLKILEMLQNGQLDVEGANTLLKALD